MLISELFHSGFTPSFESIVAEISPLWQSQFLCGASLGRGGGTNFFSRHLGHMIKMAATPIYGKTLQISSPEPADFHETWYVASGTPAHHSMFNDDPGVTLTYFLARSNLVT